MHAADALLLIANTTPGAEATVPGKLFEYLAVDRPILGIAPRSSSTEDVLAATGGGWLVPPEDPAAIACTLKQAFDQLRTGHRPSVDARRRAQFDRRVLTGDLAEIFERAARRA
jgi:glycosyltransferase involved in cell wall biosynthesis